MKTNLQYEEHIKEILESLVEAQNTQDLLSFLFEKVNAILPFDDAGLFHIREDGSHRDYAVDYYNAHKASLKIKTSGLMGYLPFDEALNSLLQETKITDFELLVKEFEHHPHFPYLLEEGLREFISGPLFAGDEPFGLLILWSEKKGTFSETHFSIFNEIKTLISIVFKRILDRDLIEAEKEFSTKLLNISKAVANIADPTDLYKTIYKTIKPIFPFDEPGLFILSDGGEHHYELLEAASLNSPVVQHIIERRLGKYTLYDTKESAISWLIENGPGIYSLETIDKQTSHPQLPLMLEAGLKQTIAGPLTYGGQVIGMIAFNSKQEGFYKEEHLPLFKAVSNQIAVAAKNVLSNQEIEKRDIEKSQLLEITQKVNELRNLPEFLEFVITQLKPIFNFHDVGIFILTDDKEFHYDLAATNPEISPSEWNKKLQSTGINLVAHQGSVVDYMMAQPDKKSKVALLDFKKLIKLYPDYYQVETFDLDESGYRDCLVCNFEIGGEPIGMFCINALQKNFFKESQFQLFQNVTEQLSVAISNILAENRLSKEKDFSNTLLQLTETISSATTPLELYETITQPVKKVIPFDHLGILILDENKRQHYELLSERFDVASPLTIEKLSSAKRYEHKGTSVEWLMDNGPVVVSMDYLEKNTSHPRNKDMVASGLKTLLGGPLIANGELFGMMAFKSKTEDIYTEEHIAYYRAISKQVAVTVSNILAQHHLVQEKKFSETLLHITESLSSVRSTSGLYKRIFESVKPVFPFEEMAIMLLDKTGAYNYELSDDTKSIHRDVPNMAEELWGKPVIFEHRGSITEWFKENGPVAISIEDAEKQVHEELHEHLLNAGFHHIIGGPLVSDGKPFGILVFFSKTKGFYKDDHIPMYKAINEQVSLAVSNILSSEEVSKQNALQSLEIELSQNIPSIKDYLSFFGSFLQHLKDFIPFTYAMVHFKESGDETQRYEWLTPLEKRSLGISEMTQMYGLNEQEIKTQEKEVLRYKLGKKGFINNLSEEKKLSFITLVKSVKLSSMLKKEYQIDGGKSKLTIVLFHRQPYKYLPSDYESLSSLQNTIALSFDNMLASREIEELSEQLQLEKNYLETAVREAYNFGDMVGESEVMHDVFQQIKEVSEVDATTLILGETGTGKELIARAIHENSSRKKRVLVKVNCAAIPAQIVESELFGHEKGAFTGAIQRRIGKFELANHGTIFLDEIGEMPLELQTKLLRVIQEREVERLGSNTTIPLDIRIIAATNRNLIEEVEKGKFREDLYYRLNGYPIQVPPLRARGEDILLLADFFARYFSDRYALPFKGFTKNTSKRFLAYSWPGNVRELQNLLEQAVISQRGKVLEIYPGRSGVGNLEWFNTPQNKSGAMVTKPIDNMDMDAIKAEKDALEKNYLIKILESHKWRVSGKNGAAQKLGIAPSTLESRMRKLGIARS